VPIKELKSEDTASSARATRCAPDRYDKSLVHLLGLKQHRTHCANTEEYMLLRIHIISINERDGTEQKTLLGTRAHPD
jgi:hypothetical protein